MNFNYVDSNCNNLIEFEEYESFIEEIGQIQTDQMSKVSDATSLIQVDLPLGIDEKIDSQQLDPLKTFLIFTSGLVLLYAYKKVNLKFEKESQTDKFSKELRV